MNLRMAVQFRLAAGILVYAAVRESNRKGEGICVIPYSSNTVGNNSTDWNKMVGKIESDKYVFDIHWYEDEKGVMHEPKIKYMKERSK